MPTYNMTELQQATTVADVVTYANNATGQVLMGIFITALFFILLFILKRWSFDKALFAASFATFMVSLILTFAQWLNFYVMLVFLLIFAFTALYEYAVNRG